MSGISLCAGTLSVEDPEALLAEYVDPAGGYAWPAYDTLVTNGSVDLVSGDLLAPTLLNAHVDGSRFRALQDMMPRLADVARLPRVALQDADDATVALVAELFAVLDEPRYGGRSVRGTIVAKVLHRKRPDLVPIYDSRILSAYTAPGAIESHVGDRTWVAFMDSLCRHMREDLLAEGDRFADLQRFAESRGATLTRLRILDILVWMTISPWR